MSYKKKIINKYIQMENDIISYLDMIIKKLKNLFSETQRVSRILELNLIAEQLNKNFEDLLHVASHACSMPLASISIIDDKYQWIKCSIGAVFPIRSDRAESVCNITIQHPDELTLIPDLKLDSRFSHMWWVKNNFIRSYAAAPLVTHDGLVLGTLCVYHSDTPVNLTDVQQQILKILAGIVSRMLEQKNSS